MYVYVCPAGSGGLLPIVLCGDLNSTPNSPLVDFITSSFLNYSKMSATEIAGYHHDKGRSRVIPTPLLPPSMNIGPNCMYTTEQETDTANTTSSNASMLPGQQQRETTSFLKRKRSKFPVLTCPLGREIRQQWLIKDKQRQVESSSSHRTRTSKIVRGLSLIHI